eukprot:3404454-Rhodomonas_salina.1
MMIAPVRAGSQLTNLGHRGWAAAGAATESSNVTVPNWGSEEEEAAKEKGGTLWRRKSETDGGRDLTFRVEKTTTCSA